MFTMDFILYKIINALRMSQTERDRTCHEVGGGNLDEAEAPYITSASEVEDPVEVTDNNEITADLRCSIQRDFEFLKDCASHVDREVLYNLLLSQMHNSSRLKTIMCDMLQIPNAENLIREFQNAVEGLMAVNDEVQVKKSTEYVNQIKEMFPDVDTDFLVRECDGLESEEDYMRFVNTVMLSGSYHKENTNEPVRAQDGRDSELEGSPNNPYRPVVVYSSDEEVEYQTPCHRKVGKTKEADDGAVPSTSKSVSNSSMFNDEYSGSANSSYNKEVMDMDSISSPVEPEPEQTNGVIDDSDEEWTAEGRTDDLGQEGALPFVDMNLILDSEQDSNFSADSGGSPRVDDVQEIDDFGSPTPEYLAELTSDDEFSQAVLESSEEWVAANTAELIRLFPNTDPTFLRAECVKFEGSLEAMNEFVISKLEMNDMPSRTEYEKRLEMEELQNRYTKNFSIEDFLKVIPQPWEYFNNSNRNCKKYMLHSIAFLGTTFRKMSLGMIRAILIKNKCNLYRTYKQLSNIKLTRLRGAYYNSYKYPRPTTIDIQFLQEVAFIKNEKKIKKFIEAREVERKCKLEEARRTGSLLECQCCFDSDVMVDDAIYCPRDHCFCKNCLVKLVEVEMGQGNYQFACLAGCGEKYTLSSLQHALPPKMFSKVVRLIQMEEIKAAGIEDLVQCPFCNYATIMPPEAKIVTCLNPECQKESCRLCKELSHIPLRCDEVEKSEEVKMRTYIENKMTEALIRRCYKCGKAFVKEEGCNKMECSCGAKMCYVCRKPVQNYSHFNAQGGTEYHKCPLYSTNDELHVDLVERVAEEAKAEVLRANPDKTLKYDPTMVLPTRSYDEPMPGMNRGAGFVAGLLAIRPRQGVDRQGT
ncbi:UNVERIFIED_CONTAM: hypothetical protein PYX00_002353 [Menopon gallinae]|uniref:RING-type domain-containing protein n=2 Tax=Menopon gallinae TaxID=328185 RepID=A0AAW2IGT6_9NEOP